MLAVSDFIPSATDPEEQRKAKILNILLAIIFGLDLLFAVAFTIGSLVTGTVGAAGFWLAVIVSVIFAIGPALLYIANRRTQALAIRVAFVVMLLAAFAISDTPEALIAGRSIMVWSIPVLVASFIIRPAASFWAALVVTGIIAVLSFTSGVRPNLPALFTFYVLAGVSWLQTRTMENSIALARETNAKLDQLVRERTAELRGILESIGDGVLVYREDVILSANPAMEQVLGRGLVVQSSMKQLPDDLRTTLEKLPTTASTRVNVKGRYYSVNKTHLIYADGDTPAGEILAFRDITEMVEAEKMKDNFLSTVSHELRTPLNAIIGYADMFMDGALGELSKDGQQTMQRVLHNGRRMMTMVNNILDQARANAGRLSVTLMPESLEPIFSEVEDATHVLAKQKGLDLSFDVAESLPDTVKVDAQALSRVLINLVGNAIKFTNDGYVKVQAAPNGKTWSVTVRDSGVGIPEEEQTAIFEAFRMVEDPKTRKAQGTGLGLSISRELVTLMDGTLSVKSTPGEGTTFTVTLPLA